MCQDWLGADLLVSGQDATHEPAMCPCDQESQWYPCVHWEEHCQQIKGADPAPVPHPGEATSGLLCQILGSSVQERHESLGVGPVEDYKDD